MSKVIEWVIAAILAVVIVLKGLEMYLDNQWQEVWDLNIVPLLLLIAMLLVVSGIGYALYRAVKRRRADN